MTKQHFTFQEVFRFGWLKTQQHAWFLLCATMIMAVVIGAIEKMTILQPLFALLIALSLISISLVMVKDESFTFSHLFHSLRSPKITLNFIVLTALYAVIVFAFFVPFFASLSVLSLGIISGSPYFSLLKASGISIASLILFIPGVWVAVRFKFYPYVVIENENMNLFDLIKRSYAITEGSFWKLFWFFALVTMINLIGFSLLGFGLILTIPVTLLSMAHLYKKLQGH